jgi:uridine kinase
LSSGAETPEPRPALEPVASASVCPWLRKLIESRLASRTEERALIVGIAGPAGVGKTTFATSLAEELAENGHRTFVLSLDDFFRSPAQRATLGRWGPHHVRLAELRDLLTQIRAGCTSFRTQRYVRSPERLMADWDLRLDGVRVLLFEGLYALSDQADTGRFRPLLDLGIYLSADLETVKQWRLQQESEKPHGLTREEIERVWEEEILPDFMLNVSPTINSAEIALYVDQCRRYSVMSTKISDMPA